MIKKITRKLALLASCAAVALALTPALAFADSSDIVTLGADLTAEQRADVLSFFGLSESDLAGLDVVTVTNADEHRYCDGTIPASVTGSKALSCSYIQPTTTGGINVRTANLTYVTSEALHNALQTAGIQNCNLVVTAPFAVSGTGALTGVFMAYSNSGHAVDAEKAAIAVQEMYETSDLEDQYGEEVAEAIGEVKSQVAAAGGDLTDDQLKEIIKKVAAEKGVDLSDADLDKLVKLLDKFQALDYDPAAFASTLSDMKNRLEKLETTSEGLMSTITGFFQSIMSALGISSDDATQAASSIFSKLDSGKFNLDSSGEK